MKISVSILKEKDNYKNAIEKVNKSRCDYLHLDILDNSYIKKKTFCINDFEDLKINKKLDIHLMSSDLEKRINEFSSLNPEIISFHYEVLNTEKYINLIKSKNIKVGLAINIDTNVDKIVKFLDKIDLILIMSVNPGEGGQLFNEKIISKLKYLKAIKNKYNFLIEVDGGINDKTINYIKDYTDIVVAGSFITDSENYDESIDKLF